MARGGPGKILDEQLSEWPKQVERGFATNDDALQRSADASLPPTQRRGPRFQATARPRPFEVVVPLPLD
jgi:hypothetical protein